MQLAGCFRFFCDALQRKHFPEEVEQKTGMAHYGVDENQVGLEQVTWLNQYQKSKLLDRFTIALSIYLTS